MFGVFRKIFLACPISIRLKFWTFLYRGGLYLYRDQCTIFHHCQRLPFGLYMKFGPVDFLSREVDAMKFVAARTDIPLPTLIDFIRAPKKGNFIVMSRMPGEHADIALKDMAPHERSLLAVDFRRLVNQLQNIAPPEPGKISCFGGGPCRDPSDQFYGEVAGPFDDEDAFNKFLLGNIPASFYENSILSTTHKIKHRICFTHNDLTGRNVLVKDGRVSAILDWEGAGWFPEHWDYLISVWRHIDEGWNELMHEAFSEYKLELEGEKYLWQFM